MSITLSKQYGVNPSVEQCFICGNDMGLVLFGSHYKDRNGKNARAPHHVFTGHICDDCQKVIDDGGCHIIEVRDGEENEESPYRTGRLVAIKKEASERIFGESHPIAYMPHTDFEFLFCEYLKEQSNEEE